MKKLFTTIDRKSTCVIGTGKDEKSTCIAAFTMVACACTPEVDSFSYHHPPFGVFLNYFVTSSTPSPFALISFVRG